MKISIHHLYGTGSWSDRPLLVSRDGDLFILPQSEVAGGEVAWDIPYIPTPQIAQKWAQDLAGYVDTYNLVFGYLSSKDRWRDHEKV